MEDSLVHISDNLCGWLLIVLIIDVMKMASYMEANADAPRGRKVLILIVADDGLVHH